MHFNYIPVASEFIDNEESLLKIIKDYISPLNNLGGCRITAGQVYNQTPIFYFAATGGTEQAILKIIAERNKVIKGEPVFLLAHSANNSLPSCLEILARLQQESIKGRIFFLNSPQDRNTYQQITEAIDDIEVLRFLKKSRIGLVGEPSDWLVASSPAPEIVKKVWGPEVVKIDFAEVLELIKKADPEKTDILKKVLMESSVKVTEPDSREIIDAVKVYLALKEAALKYELTAITVRCFELVQQLKTTGCFGLAQLTEDGIISGCEGDLVSTVGMLWAYKLLDEIPWMANPAQIDEINNSLFLAHCTVPKNIVEEYSLRSHFESGLGVGLQGKFSTQPVTLLRLGGKSMERIWIAEGNIIKAGFAENLCRTQAEIKLTEGGNVKDLLNSPLGNHIVMVFGHHMMRLQHWWDNIR